jgi:hypothetical protein
MAIKMALPGASWRSRRAVRRQAMAGASALGLPFVRLRVALTEIIGAWLPSPSSVETV